MKSLLLLPLLLSLPAQAFEGRDSRGNPCQAEISAGQLFIHSGSYTFASIPLVQNGSRLEFQDVLTIERDKRRYSPPIGAPITFGNVGLLRVSGAVELDESGAARRVSLRAVGGLANWWRASFSCER